MAKSKEKDKEMTLKEFAAMGGNARAKALTSAQRKASAKKAAEARWSKK